MLLEKKIWINSKDVAATFLALGRNVFPQMTELHRTQQLCCVNWTAGITAFGDENQIVRSTAEDYN